MTPCTAFTILFLFLLLHRPSLALPLPPPGGSFLLNCGADGKTEIDGVLWDSDGDYISEGKSSSIPTLGLLPALSTLRSFPYSPSEGPRRFCYSFRVNRDSLYLLRATFFHGGVPAEPPVFDLVVDGTVWAVVNTTDDYRRRMASFYEGVYDPPSNGLSLCVAGNPEYTDSNPFVSSIELILLPSSMYNSTNFTAGQALVTVGRSCFGYEGPYLRYPDDQFYRYWQPFWDSEHAVRSSQNISVSGFWNLPPAKIFENALVAENGKPLEIQWPRVSLPNASYYIALYFVDSSSHISREFDIFVNGVLFYRNLSVTSSGVSVFATNWPLSGLTKFQLVSSAASKVPPMINGGEIFGILNLAGVTRTSDVTAMMSIRTSIQNPPSNWNGDPCSPQLYAWVGVQCSKASQMRITSLNLTGMGLFGTLSSSIANLTALTGIFLGNNNFSGPIPELGRLNFLERVHLQNNQFNGSLPESLGNISKLRELFVNNNKLTGSIPAGISNRTGLDFQFAGNDLS